MAEPSKNSDPVTTEDLAEALRSLTGPVAGARAQIRQVGLVSAAVSATAILGSVFLLGRRRGRRQHTVVEVRRV